VGHAKIHIGPGRRCVSTLAAQSRSYRTARGTNRDRVLIRQLGEQLWRCEARPFGIKALTVTLSRPQGAAGAGGRIVVDDNGVVGAEQPGRAEVVAFLDGRTGTPEDLEPLSGGWWSSAWAYRAGGEELVVRFGAEKSWYEADRMAMAFAGPDLPVPVTRWLGCSKTRVCGPSPAPSWTLALVITATSCTSASPIWGGTCGPGTRMISPPRPGAWPWS